MKRKFLNALILCLLVSLKCMAVAEGVTIRNYVYAEKDGQKLTLDVYNDPSNHTFEKKPVFIFSLGGGWEGGHRQAGHALLTDFAEEGYIAIGIDYRLHIRNLKDSGVKLDKSNFCEAYATAIQMGIEDLFDATAFVIDNAEKWGADTSIVVLCGCSAGAINSATAEYLICNDHPLATSRLPKGFNYRAIIPCAGGIWVTDCTQLTWKRRPCAYIVFHGTSDEMVPYDFDTVADGKFSTFGPARYIPQLEEMQVPFMFHTYVGDTHGVAMFYDKRWVRQEMKNALGRIIWWNENIKLKINDARYDRPHKERHLKESIDKLTAAE